MSSELTSKDKNGHIYILIKETDFSVLKQWMNKSLAGRVYLYFQKG